MIMVDGLALWTAAACRNQVGMIYTVADADAKLRVVPVANFLIAGLLDRPPVDVLDVLNGRGHDPGGWFGAMDNRCLP